MPDLQAVPVGRISTALRATRSGFQAGFRDADGAEIAFDTLTQIRDLVKRAFLAGGGLGPQAPGGAPIPEPGPDTDIGPGGAPWPEPEPDTVLGNGAAYYAEFAREFEGLQPWGLSDRGGERRPSGLEIAVERLASATLMEMDAQLLDGGPERLRTFMAWASAVALSGAVDDESRYFRYRGPWLVTQLLEQDRLPGFAQAMEAQHLPPRLFESLALLDDPGFASPYRRRSQLATIPLPRLPSWHPAANRLAEMHLLPIVDCRFWAQPRTAVDLAPMVLTELIRLGQHRRGVLMGELTPAEVAFDSAVSELSFVELPAAAEDALGGFIDLSLRGWSPSPPPPAEVAAVPESRYTFPGPSPGQGESRSGPAALA